MLSSFYRIFVVFSIFSGLLVLSGCNEEPTTTVPVVNKPDPVVNLDQKKQYKVALLIPSGTEEVETANLARVFENSTRMALGRNQAESIILNVYDTKGNPNDAYLAAQKAIQDGTDFILGPFYSSSTRVISPLANISRTPVFSFSNDSRIANGYVFTLGQSFENSAERLIDYLVTQEVASVLIVHADTVSENRGAEVLASTVMDKGLEIVNILPYEYSQPGGLKAVEDITSTVEINKPDVLLLTGNPAGAVPLILELLNDREVTEGIIIAGIERWDIPNSVLTFKGLQGSLFPNIDPNQSAIFSNLYQYNYTDHPHLLASVPYDGVIAISELIRRDLDGNFTRREIVEVDEFFGASGPFKFNMDGTTKRSLAIAKIQNQKVIIVDQAPKSLKEALPPSPIENLPPYPTPDFVQVNLE